MLTGIIGGLGSGKTLFMTVCGYLEYLTGRSVLSNYHLAFPYNYLKLSEIISKIRNKEQLQNVVLLIDEIHIAFDARCSMSDRNRYGSYFVLQTRKRDVHLYFTSQSIWQVDVRIRENLDRLVVCENLKNDIFRLTIMDYTKEPALERSVCMHGKAFYNLYDTKEIIDIAEGFDERPKKRKREIEDD